MEIRKLTEKNHLQKNKIKHHVKKLMVVQKKGLLPKQSNALNTSATRRRSGEKGKFHQTLNLAFHPDPLNLSALGNTKDGTASPELTSPIVDRSQHFEPTVVPSLDTNDPLNLNHVDDGSLTKPVRKRKKRKRRNTGGGLTDTEELASSLNNGVEGVADESIDQSDNSILHEQVVAKKIEIPEPDSAGRKVETTRDSSVPQLDKNIHNKCNKLLNYKRHRPIKFNEKNKRYRYGNYVDCNDGLRKNMVDQRLNFFSKDWFEGKKCLDVGCNTGKVTILVAKHFTPSRIVGVDIDSNLIKIAKRKAQEYSSTNKNLSKYPMSFNLTYGPILGVQMINKSGDFPDNLSFHTENFVPESWELLQSVEAEYECILCLNVTKWVHLNFGDSGLKRFFKKLFLLLKPGGRLLLQPQCYNSYKKKKNMVPESWKHFTEIELMPTDFVSYLLSGEIGFARSECLTYSRKGKTGHDRPLYILLKSDSK